MPPSDTDPGIGLDLSISIGSSPCPAVNNFTTKQQVSVKQCSMSFERTSSVEVCKPNNSFSWFKSYDRQDKYNKYPLMMDVSFTRLGGTKLFPKYMKNTMQ